MATIDRLAEAALHRDSLAVRSLAQDLLHEYPQLSSVAHPVASDRRIQVIAAALIELLALRTQQSPPSWTAPIGEMDEPFHLLQSVSQMPRLRAACEQESPEPLRRRKLFAPADYLTFV
jgi:hypothetical protein